MTAPCSPHPFDTDTAFDTVAPGKFASNLSSGWNNNTGHPNGGYVLAVCLRSLLATVPMPHPRAVAASYVRSTESGPASIETDLVHTGRRVATAEGRLVQHGIERLRVIAQFGDLHNTGEPTLASDDPPDLPPPEHCVDLVAGAPIPLVTFTDNVEYRYPEMPGWRTGKPSGVTTSKFWTRFKEHRPADSLGLTCLVDAGAAPVMEIGAAGSATIALSVYLWREAGPEWLAYRAVTRHIIGGYHDEDVEIWDCDGRLLAEAHKFALIRPSPHPTKERGPTLEGQ